MQAIFGKSPRYNKKSFCKNAEAFFNSHYYSQSSAVSIPSITDCVADEVGALETVELVLSVSLLSGVLLKTSFDEVDELPPFDDDSNGPLI